MSELMSVSRSAARAGSTAVLAPVAAVGPEFDFSAADFATVRALIRERAGISLHEGKRAMVYGRLSRRMRETAHRSVASYLQSLQCARGAEAESEWQEFVNCLTTNLTAFFREEHHFAALAEDLRAAAAAAAGRRLGIWCCAASTGEEPYSIAMTVLETLGAGASVRIVASDIDSKVLAVARRGVYAADAAGLSSHRLRRHFLRGTGANQGLVRVRPELARWVDFRRINLMSRDWALGEAFDLIFCRNVMIYFDAATQRELLGRLHGALRPAGLLYVGHSEHFNDAHDLFRLRGKTIYRRV